MKAAAALALMNFGGRTILSSRRAHGASAIPTHSANVDRQFGHAPTWIRVSSGSRTGS